MVCLTSIKGTIKPLVFACPLFREFREPNNTAKLEGTDIDTIPALIGIGLENWLIVKQSVNTDASNGLTAPLATQFMAGKYRSVLVVFA